MPRIDTMRHAELFLPENFHHPVTVIGAGATGSFVVYQLAKLGIENITVYDFDVIEEHNIANQLYEINQVGWSKVDALSALICASTETEINIKNEPFTNQRLSGVVFMMIDTMSGRKEIWENAVKLKPSVKHYIEPRMGLDVGRIYNVTPTDLKHVAAYEDTFYSDDVAEVSSCGASMSVITTAMSVASMCVRQLINWHNDVELDNEILVDLKYNNFINSRW